MNRSWSATLALLLLLQGGGAVIRGTILDAVTGRPIRGVRINILTSSAVSAEDGHFELSNIPPGTQNLITNIDGYLPAPGRDRYITVGAGQQIDDLIVRLTPVGILTGIVLNSRGEPVVGADILAYQEKYNSKGALQLQATAGGLPSNRTDDRGRFRLYRFLEAGDYAVRVEPPQLTPGNSGESFAPYYFPGTTDPEKAGRYTVRAGEETDVKIITLPKEDGARLRVRVIDQSGAENPSKQVLLRVLRSDMEGLGLRFGPFPSDTSKDVGKLPPGKYDVYASAIFPAPPTTPGSPTRLENRPTAAGHTLVEIIDRDVDVEVVIHKGGKLTGNVVAESRTGTTTPVTDAHVTFENLKLYISVNGGSDSEGSFVIPSVADGEYRFSGVNGGPPNMIVKAVTSGDRDVLAQGLRMSGSDTEVRVVLALPAATIRGTVFDDNGEKSRGVSVFAIGPEGRPRFQSGEFCEWMDTQADQNGDFKLNVPLTGNYQLFAGNGLDRCAPMNEDFIRKVSDKVGRIRVDGSEPTPIRLISITP